MAPQPISSKDITTVWSDFLIPVAKLSAIGAKSTFLPFSSKCSMLLQSETLRTYQLQVVRTREIPVHIQSAVAKWIGAHAKCRRRLRRLLLLRPMSLPPVAALAFSFWSTVTSLSCCTLLLLLSLLLLLLLLSFLFVELAILITGMQNKRLHVCVMMSAILEGRSPLTSDFRHENCDGDEVGTSPKILWITYVRVYEP